MLKFKYFISILFVLCKSYSSFSQITYTKFEKKQEELVSKSEPYDSIINWNISYKKSENRKYIGQRIYLPKNKIVEKPEGDVLNLFLFTKNKTTFVLDSTNTTDELFKRFSSSQYNPKKYKYPQGYVFIDSISSNIYKPLFICGTCGDIKMDFENSNIIQDKYYTITNVLYGDKLNAMDFSSVWYLKGDTKSNNNSTKDKSNVNYWSDIRAEKYSYEIAFELQDEITNEIIYYSHRDFNSRNIKFILVSYFVKQKELYKGENLVFTNNTGSYSKMEDLIKVESTEDNNGKVITKPKIVELGLNKNEIWKCIDVTILENEKELSYILQNEKDETIAINSLEYFDFEKNILLAQKLAKENSQRIQLERENDIRLQKLKDTINLENRKKECIAKFGSELGTIIASHKVKIGMTKEMCRMSWGKPFWSDKTTTSTNKTENWYYGLAHSLHFEGNLLERIEE